MQHLFVFEQPEQHENDFMDLIQVKYIEQTENIHFKTEKIIRREFAAQSKTTGFMQGGQVRQRGKSSIEDW